MRLVLAALLLQAAPPSEADALRGAVAAIAAAARENAARPAAERLSGDALADLYIRRACGAAPTGRAAVLAIALALDETSTLERHPLLGEALRGAETAEERKARVAAMGKPTLRGRGDWLRHFVVSAGLAILAGEGEAEAAGIQKEVADAAAKGRGNGSGFSYSDLASNFAGIAFAGRLTGADGAKARERAAASFAGPDYLPDPAELKEGLTLVEFEESWGGVKDPRFRAECARLKVKVQACAGHRP